MKKKMSKTTKTLTALVVALSLMVVSLLGVTAAWFTDSKSYTNSLQFGNVMLDVTGGVTEATKTINFTFSRNGANKVMPGDTVGMTFNVKLKDGSDPAYYLVSITDTKGVFENGTYYYDGTTMKQNTDQDTGVGALSGSATHPFTLSKEIDDSYEDQGGSTDVSLNIFAIQQANLKSCDESDQTHSAYHILSKTIDLEVNGVNLPSVDDLQSVVTNWTSLTSVGFYYTKDFSTTEYTLNDALTTSLDAKLKGNSKGQISVYKKSDTEIAFVSDYKINAPVSCDSFFGRSSKDLAFQSINLSNFDTRNVRDMGFMFCSCKNLISLDLTGFDTSKVTDMGGMFTGCYSLTTLDLSGFDTSKVTYWINSFVMAFNNNLGNAQLIIGDGFVKDGVKVTKAVLTDNSDIRAPFCLNSSVTVMRNGVEVTA